MKVAIKKKKLNINIIDKWLIWQLLIIFKSGQS